MLVTACKYLLMLVNKKALLNALFFFFLFFLLPDFTKRRRCLSVPSETAAGFMQDLRLMDASAAVLRCFLPQALLTDAPLCYIILLFCPAVLCQYGLANRLWLTGDCVG